MKSNTKVPVEVYSRVVGYYRPVNQWNNGKRDEFCARKEYNPDNIRKDIVCKEEVEVQVIA